MTQKRSYAAGFRDEFERAEQNERTWQAQRPDRHPSIHQVRAIENGGGKSFAALFRGVFEEALEKAASDQPDTKEAPALAYYGKGRPVIIDVEGTKKYVYSDGSIDRGSIVSPAVETRAFEIGAIATGVEQIAEDIPETDMARINAASFYGLHGQELDDFLAGMEAPEIPTPIGLGNVPADCDEQPQAQAA